jgi:hypothetical protein
MGRATLGTRPSTVRDLMRPRLTSLRRQLEIVVLELLLFALRLPRRLLRIRRAAPQSRRARVAVSASLVLLPSLAVGGVLMQRAAAHEHQAAVPLIAGAPEPTPSPATYAPSVFAAAAKRAPAAPALQRLPQVDLNGLSVAGIPRAALRAYVSAATMADRLDASCHVRWWLLAGIGMVESGHAHDGGSELSRWNGIARPPIFGPRLDGRDGYGEIRDTDHGVFDRDKAWDRAVGPMQFLPQTWAMWGGTTKGHPRDPQDIRAATLAAARYLCAGSADLSHPQGLAAAVYSYNHSFDYVRLVLTVAARYAGIDPNSLGVDHLPHDKAAKTRASSSPTPSATSTTSASANGAASSPSPSPSPTDSASSSPTPGSGGGPTLPPVPTPSGTPIPLGG